MPRRQVQETATPTGAIYQGEYAMNKYDSLKQYLISKAEDTVVLSFKEIEKIIGATLPKSAKTHQAWWSSSGHSHAQIWEESGYKAVNVGLNQISERMEFARCKMDCKTKSIVYSAICCFFEDVIVQDGIEIYNEFSLQHELGIYLRCRLHDYKTQFERNISHFGYSEKAIKKEIDIAVFREDQAERYAIELKCPLNGQFPEQLFSFVKDIKFMEQLKESGFTNTYAVALVRDRPFYEGTTNDGIYRFFRQEYSVYGSITKPTGKKDEVVSLSGVYRFEWKQLRDGRRYYIIEI